MARPLKTGVDYFPLDTDFFTDKKIRLLKGEFGARGLLIVLSTFCRVYSTNGYYASFDNDDAILTADELGCGITPELVREVVQGSVKRSLFDEGVFNQFGVLTSPGIQRRFIRAISKRDDIAVFQEYWLLNIDDPNDVPQAMRNKVTLKSVSGEKTGVSGGKNPVNSSGNPLKESRVKESRVKESRAEEDEAAAADFHTLEAYASGNLAVLSPRNMEELLAFREDLPEDLVRHAIDEACANGKRTWAYTRSILARYLQKGIRTVGAAVADKEAFRQGALKSAPQTNPALNYAQRSNEETNYKSLFISLDDYEG